MKPEDEAAERLHEELKSNPLEARQIIACRIRSNDHFREFLLTVSPHERRKLYDALSPYLTFKVKSFLSLNPWEH